MAGEKMQLRQETTSASPFLVVHPLEATMKKTVILCGVLLALSASLASAAGINMAWNNCAGGGGLHDMTFGCTTNSAASAHTFVASFTGPAGITAYVSNQATVIVTSSLATLPDWWAIKGTGQCRTNAATADANFATGPFGCTDLWAGTASGALASYNVGFGTPNKGRMNLVFAVAADGAAPLNAGEEYYAFKVLILNTKTVGTGSCAGCISPAILTCVDLQVLQPNGTPGGNVDLTTAADGNTSNCITWNNSAPDACVPPTATRNATWGSIKSLYR